MRKIAYLLPGAVLSVGLALAGASAAGASTTLLHGPGTVTAAAAHVRVHAPHSAKSAGAVKPQAIVATSTSEELAGQVVAGNGLQPYSDIRAHPSLPVENICDTAGVIATSGPYDGQLICPDNSGVLPDSLAIGVAMGENLSTGGQVYGLGAVLDDNRTSFSPTSTAEPVDAINWSESTCLPDQYTVEAGEADHAASPAPVPTADLFPLLFGGQDICLNEGTVGDWFEQYHSTHDRTMSMIVGPSESNDNVLFNFRNVAQDFRAPAVGITTTDGNVASNLLAGTLSLFGSEGIGLTLIVNNGVGAHQERVTYSEQNIEDYIGTVNGGPVTGANAQTLAIGPGTGHGSSISIIASPAP